MSSILLHQSSKADLSQLKVDFNSLAPDVRHEFSEPSVESVFLEQSLTVIERELTQYPDLTILAEKAKLAESNMRSLLENEEKEINNLPTQEIRLKKEQLTSQVQPETDHKIETPWSILIRRELTADNIDKQIEYLNKYRHFLSPKFQLEKNFKIWRYFRRDATKQSKVEGYALKVLTLVFVLFNIRYYQKHQTQDDQFNHYVNTICDYSLEHFANNPDFIAQIYLSRANYSLMKVKSYQYDHSIQTSSFYDDAEKDFNKILSLDVDETIKSECRDSIKIILKSKNKPVESKDRKRLPPVKGKTANPSTITKALPVKIKTVKENDSKTKINAYKADDNIWLLKRIKRAAPDKRLHQHIYALEREFYLFKSMINKGTITTFKKRQLKKCLDSLEIILNRYYLLLDCNSSMASSFDTNDEKLPQRNTVLRDLRQHLYQGILPEEKVLADKLYRYQILDESIINSVKSNLINQFIEAFKATLNELSLTEKDVAFILKGSTTDKFYIHKQDRSGRIVDLDLYVRLISVKARFNIHAFKDKFQDHCKEFAMLEFSSWGYSDISFNCHGITIDHVSLDSTIQSHHANGNKRVKPIAIFEHESSYDLLGEQLSLVDNDLEPRDVCNRINSGLSEIRQEILDSKPNASIAGFVIKKVMIYISVFQLQPGLKTKEYLGRVVSNSHLLLLTFSVLHRKYIIKNADYTLYKALINYPLPTIIDKTPYSISLSHIRTLFTTGCRDTALMDAKSITRPAPTKVYRRHCRRRP